MSTTGKKSAKRGEKVEQQPQKPDLTVTRTGVYQHLHELAHDITDSKALAAISQMIQELESRAHEADNGRADGS